MPWSCIAACRSGSNTDWRLRKLESASDASLARSSEALTSFSATLMRSLRLRSLSWLTSRSPMRSSKALTLRASSAV